MSLTTSPKTILVISLLIFTISFIGINSQNLFLANLFGIISTLALIPLFYFGRRLVGEGQRRAVVWSFLSPFFMGIFALPFSIFGFIHARKELSSGYKLAVVPLVLYLFNIFLQILSLFTLASVFFT